MSADATVELAQRLGYVFAQPTLLSQALTHASAINEVAGASNERLEFLGDAVLGLVVANYLIGKFPNAPEGVLSRMRASVVSEPALAVLARSLDVGPHLVLGRGEDRDGGRDKDAVLADAMEALLGAVYLDGGFAAARAVVERLMAASLAQLSVTAARDPKTQLQELVQATQRCTPHYELVAQEGPSHARVFLVGVSWQGVERGRGQGKSKKAAEHAAAIAALANVAKTSPKPNLG